MHSVYLSKISSIFIMFVIVFFLTGCIDRLRPPTQPAGPIIGQCTMEAKLCSDGSSVGRSGPDCAFAPCPGETGVCADEATCTTPADARCALLPDPGECKAKLPRFHFDPAAGVCRQFDWGGCGDVAPFETIVACESACLRISDRETPSLDDCLSSDSTRAVRCQEFLATVTDFESCLRAGFPLEGTDKEQCFSPDGRVHDNTGYPVRGEGESYVAWRRIQDAIKNCQAESTMQTHRQVVTVKLKTGERWVSMEPGIDDIFALVEEAEPQCGRIQMATE